MNGRWTRGFEIAKAAAKHSNGRTTSHRMGAAMFSGNITLSIGFNQWGQTHPKSREFSRKNPHDKNLHAEISALLKRQYYNDKDLIMYVHRENIDGKPVCSKPCENCAFLMKEAGVRRVRFYDNEGNPSEMVLR